MSKTVPMHALDRRCRHNRQAGARGAGLGDVCGMSRIKGLNHVDAIAQGPEKNPTKRLTPQGEHHRR
jgi:hypothetical protein